jgi:hypothetical protein
MANNSKKSRQEFRVHALSLAQQQEIAPLPAPLPVPGSRLRSRFPAPGSAPRSRLPAPLPLADPASPLALFAPLQIPALH